MHLILDLTHSLTTHSVLDQLDAYHLDSHMLFLSNLLGH